MLFAAGGAAQQAAGVEVLVVVGVDRLPAELLLHVFGGGLLNEGVFGAGYSHRHLSVHQARQEEVAGLGE